MIKVLLFAQMKEMVGSGEIVIDQDRMTIGELKQYMNQRYGMHENAPMMVAVNEQFADDKQEVVSGQVVAFIPPVSGG
ncbi:molybdopterin converting factor subunit 1 [Paenibacillus sp. KN14-4R]|uniref:molybdopterin converting factor subunit 1 n=1 Tax=Paenibacillus sp. KN14-4R TaxID=3445773 RepID=UPI003FA0A917